MKSVRSKQKDWVIPGGGDPWGDLQFEADGDTVWLQFKIHHPDYWKILLMSSKIRSSIEPDAEGLCLKEISQKLDMSVEEVKDVINTSNARSKWFTEKWEDCEEKME